MKRNRLLFFLCIIVALLTLLLVLFSFISLGKEYTSIKAVEALHIEENNSSETNEDEKKCLFLHKKETSSSLPSIKCLKSAAKLVRNVIKSKLFSCKLNIPFLLISENM